MAKDQNKQDENSDVERRVREEQERGFRGVEVDTTPNEAYSVQGVVSGAPTPETDEDQADRAAKRAREVARESQTPKSPGRSQ